jgi:acetyltransferase-like isoleucine patch superfamily enzyme
VQCDVTIGSKVLIAGGVAFVGRDDHRIDIPGVAIWDSGRGDSFETVVEDDVWIGFGAIIVAGSTIGRGSVIAAGSVVTSKIPRYSIAGGIPARVLRPRFSTEQIAIHECKLGYHDEH